MKLKRDWRAVHVRGQRDWYWRYCEFCPPGTPAGPDPDRAEMLLAELFARWDDNRRGEPSCSTVGTCWLCAIGALDGDGQEAGFRRLDPHQCGLDAGEMDNYAAGLAFVTALESA